MPQPTKLKTKQPEQQLKAVASKKRGVTRNSLMDAGLKLFAEKGFDGASVKDIEAEVGLTPGSGSFYRHFKSKEDLMEQVVHREIEKVRSWRDLRERATGGSLGDRRAELIMSFRMSLIGLNEIKPLIMLLGREYGQGRFPELMQQLRQLLVDESVEFQSEEYAEDMKNGILKGNDPEVLSSVLMSALVGYHLSNTFFESAPAGIDSDRFVEGLVDLVMAD
jgi:AcrR family transcriptional regulator